jgi:uncharacterized membrane protein YqjE
MAGETMRARNPAGHAGLFNNLLALVNALAGFLESRLALFAQESKGALVQLLLIAACLVVALMFFALGYLFLLASAVAAIARVTEISWTWIAIAAGGLHFVLAVICLLIGYARVVKPPFRELSAELQKDREWLKNLDQTSRPTP